MVIFIPQETGGRREPALGMVSLKGHVVSCELRLVTNLITVRGGDIGKLRALLRQFTSEFSNAHIQSVALAVQVRKVSCVFAPSVIPLCEQVEPGVDYSLGQSVFSGKNTEKRGGLNHSL